MKKSYLLGLIATGAMACSAAADIIPTLSSITDNGGNSFTWNYTATVTNDQMVQTGNYFTIYDFSSISPVVASAPAGWTFTTSLIGTTPALVNPVDSASLYNVTFTYAGAPLVGPQPLGTFSINTDTNQLTSGYFAAEAMRSGGPNAGTSIDNVGRVAVPVPEMSALAPLIGVCGIGAVGFVSSILRRRQKQS